MNVVVVGAGIVGTSVAYSMLKRGAAVTLVESKGVASGTTSTSYAWINSHKKHPESYHALNLEGLKYWTNVVSKKYPEVVELNGHVEFALNEEHRDTLTQRVERLQSLDYAAQWLTVNEARSLTPVDIPDGALVGYFSWEGHSYPGKLASVLIEEMQTYPEFSMIIDSVVSVERTEGRVGLRSGLSLTADAIVLAVGNSTTEVAATADIDLPMVPREVGGAAFGYLTYVEAKDHGLAGPVTTDRLNLRPNGPDHLLLQALDLDATADPDISVPKAIEEEFTVRLGELLPSISVTLEEVRVGHRVIPGDGLTVAGPATEESGNRLWIAVTHSGVVLGPWLGESLADEICSGKKEPLFGDFRPARFLTWVTREYSSPRKPGDQ